MVYFTVKHSFVCVFFSTVYFRWNQFSSVSHWTVTWNYVTFTPPVGEMGRFNTAFSCLHSFFRPSSIRWSCSQSHPWVYHSFVSFYCSLLIANMSSCVLSPSLQSLLWAVAGSSWSPAGPDESSLTHESSRLRRCNIPYYTHETRCVICATL